MAIKLLKFWAGAPRATGGRRSNADWEDGMFTVHGILAEMSRLVYIYRRGPRSERGISMNSLGIPIQAGGIAQKSKRGIARGRDVVAV
jgi:hypothetical protein